MKTACGMNELEREFECWERASDKPVDFGVNSKLMCSVCSISENFDPKPRYTTNRSRPMKITKQGKTTT